MLYGGTLVSPDDHPLLCYWALWVSVKIFLFGDEKVKCCCISSLNPTDLSYAETTVCRGEAWLGRWATWVRTLGYRASSPLLFLSVSHPP